jgi:Fe-Mn family superoxide dismutase
MFTLPQLPYKTNALEPVINTETVEIHYGKHHQWYVNKLNELIVGSAFENRQLEEIIKTADWVIFNNAAQVRNHSFYRNGLQSPKESNEPRWELYDAIVGKRTSFEAFKEAMTASAIGNFGSGWTWLVKNTDGSLEIMNTSNAWCPLTTGKIPLVTIDVREHAYYLKYQNRRPEYIENIWKCINWDKALELYNG